MKKLFYFLSSFLFILLFNFSITNSYNPVLLDHTPTPSVKYAREDTGTINEGTLILGYLFSEASTTFPQSRIWELKVDYSIDLILSETNDNNGLTIESFFINLDYQFSSPIIWSNSLIEDYTQFNYTDNNVVNIYKEISVDMDLLSFDTNQVFEVTSGMFDNQEIEIGFTFFGLTEYDYLDLANDFYIFSLYNWRYLYNTYSIPYLTNGDIFLINDGIRAGEDIGYELGYNARTNEYDNTDSAFNNIWTIISNAFASVFNVFDIELFAGIKLFHILAIPIIVSVLYFVIKILAK